ncbi:MAG TPA: hypothetical protein VM578_12190 [Candidatus Saccharimonadales bacterium]|nr:hypothetical protein [Candidatus Saccharimonadales bacterium]
MNVPLLVAALLAILVGIAHSLLGERNILEPLLRLQDLPAIRGNRDYMGWTLRAAWHLTSVFIFGMAALLAKTSVAAPFRDSATVRLISLTFFSAGFITLAITRGRHFAWIMFFLIATLAWIGSNK